MQRAEFITLIEEILEVDPGTVGVDDSLVDLDWDSLCNLSLMSEIDVRTGGTLAADDLAAAKTVGDLERLVATASAA